MGGTISEDEVDRWLEDNRAEEAAAVNEHIKQLERLNATLAAEVDAQRPVVEAAQNYKRRMVVSESSSGIELITAVTAYEATKRESANELPSTR